MLPNYVVLIRMSFAFNYLYRRNRTKIWNFNLFNLKDPRVTRDQKEIKVS